MTYKLIAGMVMAGSLFASGVATAAPWSYTTTLGAWATGGPVVDGDGDMSFSFIEMAGLGADVAVTFEEFEIGGVDYYDVGLAWAVPGYAGEGQLAYAMAVLKGDELIRSAELSITQTGSVLPQVQKLVYDLDASVPFATLAVPPSPSAANFAGRRTLVVRDYIPAQTGGTVQDLHNSFTAAIPEPSTYALLLAGLGVLGLVARRRST